MYNVGDEVFILRTFCGRVLGIDKTKIAKKEGQRIYLTGYVADYRAFDDKDARGAYVFYPTFDDAMRGKIQMHIALVREELRNAMEGMSYMKSNDEQRLSKVMAVLHDLEITQS